MNEKNKLLSIGKVSKLTGASPRSLRYYERIGLLEPAFIDPDSGYRYYSFDQVYLVDMIKICIEFDIPLKMLEQYLDADGVIDAAALVAYGKQIAEEKMKALQRGLSFIHALEKNIALAEKYPQDGQIYTRDIPEKIFCVMPLEKPFEEADPFEVAGMFQDFGFEYRIEETELLWAFGFLCEYSPHGVERYIFMELQKHTGHENIKVIPAGTYFCKKNDMSTIEQAPDIFKKQLKGKKSFLAIETELFTGKHKISSPMNELRALIL